MRVRHPELVLAAAVLVSLPMIPGLLDGGISPMTVLVRFLIALIVCWIGGSILSRLLTNYTNQVRRAEIQKQIDEENERRKALIEMERNRQTQPNVGSQVQNPANSSRPNGGNPNGSILGGAGNATGAGGAGGSNVTGRPTDNPTGFGKNIP